MAAGQGALAETARAKVNLTLRVVGRRPDGYHDLESLVAFADCADRLTLSPEAPLSLTVSGPGAADCGEGADNLVLKAASALAARVEGLRIGAFHLEKHLPVAAGIGGGSADAAAALRLLARINQLELDDPRLIEAARATGADVPVCLASQSCIMTGVGDTLTPWATPKIPALLVNPRVAVATADVFAALGLRAGELRVGVADVVQEDWPEADAPFDAWIAALARRGNDLEAAAIAVQPAIAAVLERLRALPGVTLVRMSGSGATCFALFERGEEASGALAALRTAEPGWWAHSGTLG